MCSLKISTIIAISSLLCIAKENSEMQETKAIGDFRIYSTIQTASRITSWTGTGIVTYSIIKQGFSEKKY